MEYHYKYLFYSFFTNQPAKEMQRKEKVKALCFPPFHTKTEVYFLSRSYKKFFTIFSYLELVMVANIKVKKFSYIKNSQVCHDCYTICSYIPWPTCRPLPVPLPLGICNIANTFTFVFPQPGNFFPPTSSTKPHSHIHQTFVVNHLMHLSLVMHSASWMPVVCVLLQAVMAGHGSKQKTFQSEGSQDFVCKWAKAGLGLYLLLNGIQHCCVLPMTL